VPLDARCLGDCLGNGGKPYASHLCIARVQHNQAARRASAAHARPAYLASLTAEDKQALADVVKTVFPTGGSRCGDYAITNIALQSLGEGWGTRLMGDVTTIGPRPATITMEIHVYDLTGRAVDVASFHAENLKPGELRPFWVWFPQARPQDIHTLRTSLVSEQ